MGQTSNLQQKSIYNHPSLKGAKQINCSHLQSHQSLIEMHLTEKGPLAIISSIIEQTSIQKVIEITKYYSQRSKIRNPYVINLIDWDLQDEEGKSYKHNEQKNILANNVGKVDVNTICSLRLFQQNCQKPLSARYRQQFQLFFYAPYYSYTLAQQITARISKNCSFSEKQILCVIQQATIAALEMTNYNLKQPLLSPHAIKITQNGQIKIGQWQLSHFYQEKDRQGFQQSNFVEEGQAVVEFKTDRKNKISTKDTAYNIFTKYYWAPEGSGAIQMSLTLGKSLNQNCKKNHQIFSLGMTVLHMCLMRQLYQKQTFSEKQIVALLVEAINLRQQQKLSLSKQIIQLLQKMLKWDPIQRIGYAQLSKNIEFIIQNTYSKDNKNVQMINSVIYNQQHAKQIRNFVSDQGLGSGSIVQGSGDTDHPQQDNDEQTFQRCPTSKSINYLNVDYTINRQREEWQKLQTRIMSTAKSASNILYDKKTIQKSQKTQIFQKNLVKQQILFKKHTFPSEILLEDKQDQINEESSSENFKQILPIQIQKTDWEHDYICVETSYISRLQDSIKILDLSNIKAAYTQQKLKSNYSTIPFQQIDKQNSFTKLVQAKKANQTNQQNNSFSLQSSNCSFKDEEGLFTSPQLLNLIKQAASFKQNLLLLPPAKDQSNSLRNSVYVKQSFSKGYYEGGKLDGLRNGYGTFYYNQGGKYCGDWLNNKMHGKGTLYYSDGRIAYQGQWSQDALNGHGILYNENPLYLDTSYDYRGFDNIEEFWVYYQGGFKNDDKNGHNGKLFLSNGQYFQGSFRNDLIQGRGIFHMKEGKQIQGQWQNNRLIRIISIKTKQQNVFA